MLLDEVHVKKNQFDKLLADARGIANIAFWSLARPSLPFFRLCFDEVGKEFSIDYQVPDIKGWTVKGGGWASAQIRAKLYDPESLIEENVYMGLVRDKTGEPNNFSDCVLDKLKDENMAKGLAWAGYISIQHALKNRPSIFAYTSAQRIMQKQSASKEARSKRKVQTYRIITVRLEDFITPHTSDTRAFNCPCWGVIGHMRRYKSGKEVWIKPYRKGKERNKPNSYSTKEYQIVGGCPNA